MEVEEEEEETCVLLGCLRDSVISFKTQFTFPENGTEPP